MAARVVYLVVTGQVRPDEVLGLTFTTKAASELRTRIRDGAASTAGRPRRRGRRDDEEDVLEPTVATYNAYAASLLTEHGLRIGHEPDTRVITDAVALPARRAGGRPATPARSSYLTDHPADRDPEPARPRRRDERAPASRPTTCARVDAEARAGLRARRWRRRRAGKDRTTYREAIEKAISAIDRRAELLGLVEAYRRLKRRPRPDGLLRPDRARRPAGRASSPRSARSSATSSGWCCSTSTRTPRSPRPSCCPGCSPARRRRARPRGHRGRRPQPGDLRLARRLGLQHPQLRRHLPGRAAATVPVLPADRQPALRRAHPRGRQPAGRAALRRVPPGRAAGRQADGAERRRRARRGSSRPTPRSSAALVERGRATRTTAPAAGRDIGVLTRDNAHAEDVFDALTGAGIPVEIVGLSGLLRLPEVAEVVATLHLLHDVTANASLLTLLTGPRWAIGPRDLHLLGRRAGELAGRPRSRRRGRRRSATSCSRSPTASTRPRCRALGDALDDPGRRALLRRGAASGSPCSPASCGCCARTSASRCSTSSAGSSTPPASTSSSPPRSSPAAAGPPRQPRPVRQGGRRVPGGRRRRHPARAAGLPHRRGRPGQRPRRRHPDRGRLGQAAHRAPVQGPGVGLGVPGRRLRDPVPVQPRRAPCGPRRPSVLPAPLRGDAADLPQLAGLRQGRARRLPRRHPSSTTPTEELRLGYVAFTRAAHQLCGDVVPLEPASHAVRPVALPGDGARRSSTGWGEAVDGWLDKPAKGDAQPLRRRRPVAAVAADRHRPRGRAAARGGRGRSARSSPTAPDDGLDMVEAGPGRRVGRRARAAARRGPGATAAAEIARPAARPACPRPRWAGCATTPSRSPASWPGRCRASRRRRPGSAPASTPGSRRASASRTLFDYDELPGPRRRRHRRRVRARGAGRDASSPGRSPTACRTPVEAPFALVLAGQVVRGRIDAVYAEDADGERASSSSTGRPTGRRPPTRSSSAIYRLAWAELNGVPLEQVRAAFYYVRTGERRRARRPAGPSGARGAAGASERARSRDAAGRGPAGPVGADRARRRAVADQLHPRDRRPRWCRRAGCRRARERRCSGAEVGDGRPEAGGPEDHVDRLERAVGPPHAVGLDPRRTSAAARRRRAARPPAPARAARGR